jgi:RNA polymerase sigma-70 factor, ECF subfamily
MGMTIRDPRGESMPMGHTSLVLDARSNLAFAADDDRRLLSRFAAGDEAAFDDLFQKYQDYVYNICLGIVGNPEEARDCVQETFLRVYRNAREFRGQASLATWIYRIAVNYCLGQLRKRPRQATEPLEDEMGHERPDPGPSPWTVAERHEEEAEIRRIIQTLSPDYRAVLVLRYFQELSYDEIAAVMKWTMPQTKIKLHRARRAFAVAFGKAREAEGASA